MTQDTLVSLVAEAGSINQLGKHVVRIELTANTPDKRTNHTVLLLDCSGSMAPFIGEVRNDSINYVETLSDADYVSIVIFSGHGESKLIAGPTQTNKMGKSVVVAAIKAHVRVMSVTVFSEPLEKTLATVKQLAGVEMAHNAVLFTDGCAVPTRWSVDAEEDKAIDVARKLYEAGAIVSCIGYGPYYNDAFIGKLMRAAGNAGQFRHISEIEEFKTVIEEIRDGFMRTVPIDFDLSIVPDKGTAGRVFRTTPQLLSIGEAGKAFGRGALDGKLTLFVECDKACSSVTITGTVNGALLNKFVGAGKLSDEHARDFVLTLGAHASLSGNRAEAIELLTLAGEEILVDRAATNYTVREQRETGDTFRRMFVDRKFIGAGLKPTGPSHCVLNVLRILVEDSANVVYLGKGAYKRTGELTSDPRVIHPPVGRTLKVLDVQSHQERFNFSLKALKDVKVKPVDETGKIIDTAEPVDAKIWRNYVIIKDGNLHVADLEASLSEVNFNILQEAGVIPADAVFEPAKVYPINLRGLRMISTNWANPTSFGLVNLMREEDDLEAVQKALNAHIKAKGGIDKPEFDGNVYFEKGEKIEGVTQETYEAACCKYILMKNKAAAVEDISGLTAEEANVRVKKVRARLRAVRYLKRAIVFAMEMVKSRVINWDAGKENKGGKLEQLATWNGAQLKRTTWTEEEVCS